MKQIKVTDDIKAELDAIKYDKETYNLVIHRLIRECKRLFIENKRLHYDKDLLLSMVVDNADFNDVGLEFKYVPFIESVLYDNVLSDAERLEYLKKYFTEIDNPDFKLLLECVAVIKDSNDDDNSVLLDFENWIKSQ